MITETKTLTLPLMHLYHLTADPNNDTGYTIEQVVELMKEHGSDHTLEVTITTPVCEPEPISDLGEEDSQ
jgi:hypothetical protein